MKSNTRKNFIWNIVGLSAYTFVSLILLVIVKLCNGVEQAGIFSYSFSLCNLFFYSCLFFNRTYQIANYEKYKFNQFLTTRIITCLLSLLIVLIFSLISNFDIYKILIILLLLLFRIVDAISDCFYGFIQSKEKLYQVGISYFFKSFLGVIVFLIINYFLNNMILAISLLVIVNIIIFIFYDMSCYKKIKSAKISLDFSNIRNIFSDAFAVFFFSFICVYLANSQKYIITYYTTNELQTIFGILIMPATMLSLIGNYLLNPFLKVDDVYYYEDDYYDL